MALTLSPYFIFRGNCRTAMEFYQSCLGGEMQVQLVGDTPLGEGMPADMHSLVLHATLRAPGFTLMGTDMAPPSGLNAGNQMAVALEFSSASAFQACFAQLSEGGVVTHPIETTFWGSLLGSLIDRYGNSWMLHFEGNKRQD